MNCRKAFKRIVANLWEIMVDGNIASIAFNNLYKKFGMPPRNKKLIAIVAGVSFPLSFCFFAVVQWLTFLFSYRMVYLLYSAKIKEPKDE